MNPSPARRLWNGLAPPDSNDEEQLRIGSAVRLLGAGAFVGIVPFLFLEWWSGWVLQVWLLCIIELVLLGALWLNRRGHVRTAALALNTTALVCGAALVSMSAAGYRDVSLLLFPAIPVLAGLLLPRSYYWVMSAAAVLVAASLILLQTHGLVPYATQTGGYNDLIATIVILMLTSVAVGYLVVALGNSRRLAQATIDALWHHTCVLDGKGMVLAVTRASRLAEASPPIPLPAAVGVNYLDLCEKAGGSKAQETAAFAAGLRAVLRGEQEELAMEYACHSPCEDRCFLTKVRRVGAPGAIRVVIAHEDVTSQRRAEQALRLSEEQHRLLVQNLHAGVVVHAPDTSILLANEQACRLLGLSEEEIKGKVAVDPAWAFFGQDETPMPFEGYPVNRVLASGNPVRDLVAAVRRPGTEDLVWLLVNAFPELGPQGKLRQVVVTFVDITEGRRAEQERRQLQENLAQSDRLASMGVMAAGLAHEINNPLAYSLYNLESLCEDLPRYVRQLAFVQQTLADRLGESGLRQALGGHTEALEAGVWLDVEARFSDALEGTRRIKDIARRLGTFSRVEKDQVARVELLHPIDSAIGIASNEIKYRATVVREIGPTASVMGSEGRLSQVFLNLLLNAAQSIEEGAPERNTIRVSTWQEGPTVLAEVQDTGCGIPPENLEKIFDPFFTTKPVGVGSGLGLSIVRTILAGYHGTIEVESELGRGTRFLVRLPAAPAEATREPAHVDAEIGVPTSRGRLLVIDDDAGVRKALRRILDGHELIEAEAGRQACELLATDQSFDVILCDIGMPNMSGIDVHSWLLEHHPRLAQRVVFLTGGAFTPRATAYLEKVQNPQVEKPFDTANLEKLVTDYVRRRGK